MLFLPLVSRLDPSPWARPWEIKKPSICRVRVLVLCAVALELVPVPMLARSRSHHNGRISTKERETHQKPGKTHGEPYFTEGKETETTETVLRQAII